MLQCCVVTMFEIIDSQEVPSPQCVRAVTGLPIRQLEIGKAIRVPLDPSMSTRDLKKLHGAIRARACRAQPSTGNRYRVTKAEDAIYIICME